MLKTEKAETPPALIQNSPTTVSASAKINLKYHSEQYNHLQYHHHHNQHRHHDQYHHHHDQEEVSSSGQWRWQAR